MHFQSLPGMKRSAKSHLLTVSDISSGAWVTNQEHPEDEKYKYKKITNFICNEP